MSKKRDLYKPAVRESANAGTKRRPLAQGRLVTKTLFPADEGDDVSDTSSRPSDSHQRLQPGNAGPSPRRDLTALMTSVSGRDEGDTSPSTPRKCQPQVSQQPSPHPVRPSISLDLSDTEPDVFPTVVSVGGEASSPVVHVTHHSHDPVHGDLRNTGRVDVARKVPVDNLHSISIGRDSPQHLFDTERRETEEAMAGAPERRESVTEQLPQPQVREEKTAVKSKPIEQNSSQEEGNKKRARKPPKVVQSRYMAAKPALDAGRKGPMKATDRSIIGRAHSASRAAPKPTRKVAKKSSSITDARSFQSGTPEVRGSKGRNASTPARDTSLQPLGAGDVSAIAPHDSAAAAAAKYSVFSTPSLDGSSMDSMAFHSPRNKNTSRAGGGRHDSKHDSRQHSESQRGNLSRKQSAEVLQNQLMPQYCRYLQWLYLDAKARKAFDEQEKVVMEQIYGLSMECKRLEEEKTKKKLELERLKHLQVLDEVLELQEKVLAPICEQLPDVEQQYRGLAAAVDTTRHQLPIRDVVTAGAQGAQGAQGAGAQGAGAQGAGAQGAGAQGEEGLMESLQETEQLLAELHRVTKQPASAVHSFSASLGTLKQTAHAEIHQLGKVHELVSAVKSLVIHESSLLIQDMYS